MNKYLLLVILLSALFFSCSKDKLRGEEESDAFSVTGAVQKGQYSQGSSITIQELDETLNPTGKNYQTQTTNDMGAFKLGSQINSRYIEIIANGYYFNEVTGKLSESTLTLRALADLEKDSTSNVNLLTSLEFARIKHLINNEEKTVIEARDQAEKEIFNSFNIPTSEITPDGFSKMDISKEGEQNAILLAISVTLQNGRSVAELSELVSKIADDIQENGVLKNPTLVSSIRNGGKDIDMKMIFSNMENRYEALGVKDYAIPDFGGYLDVDGNGVIDKEDSWLVIDKKSYIIPQAGGEVGIGIKYNIDFEIIIPENCDWIKIKNAYRATIKEDSVRLIIYPNEEREEREAIIIITDKNSDLKQEVSIRQKQRNILELPLDVYNISAQGGTISIDFKTNDSCNINITTGKEWLHLASDSVNTENVHDDYMHSVRIKVQPNSALDKRDGKIVFSVNGLEPQTVTVTQQGDIKIKFIDNNFENYLMSNFDTNRDGYISETEALNVYDIDCSNLQIKDITEIYYFKNLNSLNCSYNQLESLDVSKNTKLYMLNCRTNQIKTLDISGCENLSIVYWVENPFEYVNIGKAVISTCYYHPDINVAACSYPVVRTTKSSLKVSGVVVKKLGVGENIQFLDVSDCPLLETLYCEFNSLVELDLSNNPFLKKLGCKNNKLKTLNINQCVNLEEIECLNNRLTSLDISKNAKLKYLDCRNNQLTTLDIKNHSFITYLLCDNNNLNVLDIDGCNNLVQISCTNNKITTLNARDISTLVYLECGRNQINSIDVSGCSKLIRLDCTANQIKTLDVSSTQLGYSSETYPLLCDQTSLDTLYLKTGWEINGINYGSPIISSSVKVLYKN